MLGVRDGVLARVFKDTDAALVLPVSDGHGERLHLTLERGLGPDSSLDCGRRYTDERLDWSGREDEDNNKNNIISNNSNRDKSPYH